MAEHAGVSVAAVSKVMRNAYGVSAALRAKVEASIAALNYRPSAAARGMRGQTYTIGVLMADIKNPFFPQLIDGIDDGLVGTQYVPLYGVGHGSSTTETAIVHALIDRLWPRRRLGGGRGSGRRFDRLGLCLRCHRLVGVDGVNQKLVNK